MPGLYSGAVSTSLGVAQIIVSAALISAILLQAKGTGLGSVFGGDGSVFRTRRGAEKGLFQLTIILAIAFGLLSIAAAALAPASL
jgi:preprotein translocase subunit SecG